MWSLGTTRWDTMTALNKRWKWKRQLSTQDMTPRITPTMWPCYGSNSLCILIRMFARFVWLKMIPQWILIVCLLVGEQHRVSIMGACRLAAIVGTTHGNKCKHFTRYWPFMRGIHRSPKASDAELWCYLWSAPEQTVEQTIETPVIWGAIALIMTSL